MNKFNLISPFKPGGDQNQAITKITKGLANGMKHQTLLGVTGSGKTFTMANVIAKHNKPTLIITHNKTLAAQLYNEFKEFFPHNRVEYFVSYYDYYQPESYIARTDTYIAKDASINEQIDALRLSATNSLITNKDVIVVASVSAIYNIGSPEEYGKTALRLKEGTVTKRSAIIASLLSAQYDRNDVEPKRGTFRVRGDTIDVFDRLDRLFVRIELDGDKIERISEVDWATGEEERHMGDVLIFPAKHFVMNEDMRKKGIGSIRKELAEHVKELNRKGKIFEAERLEKRTEYDIEMIEELGYCSGIENYSRHFDGRSPGEPPGSLLNYFSDDWLLIIDESHVTLPQIRGMIEGDRSRKRSLVDNGFRLPSAFDNRPLSYEEFAEKVNKTVYVSATPADQELKLSKQVVEQIIRPTGLLDPEIEIRKTKGQVADLVAEVKKVKKEGYRTLVTTLTKRQAEDLAEFIAEEGIKVEYLHSDIKTLERTEIIRKLRLGEIECLVGVNLLREGLDLPEVSLVAILDADKEGFLRNTRSLIQTMGRASRNSEGRVLLYADKLTDSIKKATEETQRRRKKQVEYNKKNKITPKTIVRGVHKRIVETDTDVGKIDAKKIPAKEKDFLIAELETQMNLHAEKLEFELAAEIRDKIMELRGYKSPR